MAYREYVSDKEEKKEEKKNYSHLMLTSAYAPNQLEVRDGDNQVLMWDNHPDHENSRMLMIDNPAMTISGPAYNIKNGTTSNTSYKKTSGMSMDGLFIPFATNFVIKSEAGNRGNKNRPNDGIALPTFERPFSTAQGENIEYSVDWQNNGDDRGLGANAPAPNFITSISLNPFASGHNVQVLNKNQEITNWN